VNKLCENKTNNTRAKTMEYRGQGASEASDGDPREASIVYCGSAICLFLRLFA